MTTKVKAYIEHGRWKIDCPQCSLPLVVDTSNNKAICHRCFPGLRSKAMKPPPEFWDYIRKLVAEGPNTTVEAPRGDWRMAPDHEAHTQALEAAKREKAVYEADYPRERGRIEKILRYRPKINMNWYPEGHAKLASLNREIETLEDLSKDNVIHGLPSGLEE